MKLVYNTDLQVIEEGVIIGYNINIRTDIRIESDSYTLLGTESLLVDFGLIQAFRNTDRIEKGRLKSYYIVPNDYVWGSEQSAIYKLLVDNATKCRETRVDQGRSYVSLFYIADVQKSMDFFIDTELLMNQYIKGKIPALQAFINDTSIAGFDYTTNGFSTKSYYNVTIKDQLNYLLFR